MPKRPVSVTLDANNLLWLRGRAAVTRRRSLSDALDEVVTAARTGGHGASASRSVKATVDIADVDPGLDTADAYIEATIRASLAQPMAVRGRRSRSGATSARQTASRTSKRRG